jgi:hydroxyethylthiazole kinase-like uncharacterized protein yjeF
MKVVSVAQMQKAERDCAQFGLSLAQLMENAGLAVANQMRSTLGDLRHQTIAILAGPGNNGGDGLVAARHLHDWGVKVMVYLCGPRPSPQLDQVSSRGIPCIEGITDDNCGYLIKWLKESTAVLDALLGTGTSRPITGLLLKSLNVLAEARKARPNLRLFCLDLPSGLNADSGACDPATPFADFTLTLGFPKFGLLQSDGLVRSGRVIALDIGIPSQVVENLEVEFLSDEYVARLLPARLQSSHKGSYGSVLALTGSVNYPGAAYLACTASLRAGAGLTTLAIARGLLPILAGKLTEVTYLPLPEAGQDILSRDALPLLVGRLGDFECLLLGCGLGQREEVRDLVSDLLTGPPEHLPSLVIDADGLNLLIKIPDWQKLLPGKAIFTPHPGEMSRLLNKPIAEIQINRFSLARQAAQQWQQTVVLKGAYTLIAGPDGRTMVSPFANPGLSSAGTGDVLAGVIAGLVAQGLKLPQAAACGVYLHAKAGEIVRQRLGEAGMLASDLLPALPEAIRQLKQR